MQTPCGRCQAPHEFGFACGYCGHRNLETRRFHLVRDTDVTGISGTGVVAEGCVFTDGTTIVRWLPVGGAHPRDICPTTAIHESPGSVLALHGHNGATRIEWLD